MTKESPALPEVPKKGLFVLYYRSGNNPHPQFVFFEGGGTLQNVIERARRFCESMSYRFVYCRPAIINLDEEEKRKLALEAAV